MMLHTEIQKARGRRSANLIGRILPARFLIIIRVVEAALDGRAVRRAVEAV
jgi:hypothetical protein